MPTKVCHITSVHPRNDSRIFYKECSSLAESGYEVVLLLADGKGEEMLNGVLIKSVDKPKNRVYRVTKIVTSLYNIALKEDADIYHLHDPELLRIAGKLKIAGKRVIFDSHEDVPRQIMGKMWIPTIIRQQIANTYERYQSKICGKIDGVIAATPYIGNIFLKINTNTIDICNYPKQEEFSSCEISTSNNVIYIGGISEIRGGEKMVEAIGLADKNISLKLAGNFIPESYYEDLKQIEGWERTSFMGYLTRKEVSSELGNSFAGLVVLKPLPNYLDSLPIKMFEYMAAGIPVIASDFPYWKEIVEGNNCGLVVNSLDAKEISDKINYLYNNKDIASKMGSNGKKAIKKIYNWQKESEKLVDFYKSVIENNA